MTTEIQCSFHPPHCLSGYICFRALSLRCSFELQGGNAATKKKKSTHWFRSGNKAHNEANHSEAKTEIFASELIRQGIARPKQPQTTSAEEWVCLKGSRGSVSAGGKQRRCMVSSH